MLGNMKKLLVAIVVVLFPNLVAAQNVMCPTRPSGDSSNACASTAFVQSAIVSVLARNIQIDPDFTTSPTANPTGGALLATYSTFNVQGTTDNAANREFLVGIGLTSTLGAGVANNNGDKVALYAGALGQSGSGNLWALNTVATAMPGSGSYVLHGYELDVNNYRGLSPSSCCPISLPANYIVGLDIASAVIPGTSFRANIASNIAGGEWEYGYAINGTDVSEAAFYAYTNPGAIYGIRLAGPYTYGVYVDSSAAVNFFNGPAAVNMMGSSLISGAKLDVRTNPNNRLIVKDKFNLADGITLYSVNDANSTTRGMEFGASSYLFAGAGSVSIGSTTTSTSTITGSLINAGGFGNAGTAYIGGNSYFGGDVSIGVNAFGTYSLHVQRDGNGSRLVAIENINAGTSARTGLRVLNNLAQYYELIMHSSTYTGLASVAQFNTSSTSVPIQFATGGNVRMTIAGAGNVTFSNTAPVTLASSFARAIPVTETGTTHTVATTTTHLITNNSGTVTVTLPAAASFAGRELYIKNIDGTATVVSASSNVVPRIGGAAGTAILGAVDGAWVFLVSDGSNWIIMAGS